MKHEGAKTSSVPATAPMYRFSCDQELSSANSAELYASGLCGFCGTGLGGRRRGVQRRLRGIVRDDVVFTLNGLYVLKLFSPRAKDWLHKGGLAESDFESAIDEKSNPVFELVAGGMFAPWVGLKSPWGTPDKAVFCPECQKQAFHFFREDMPGPGHFITRSACTKIPASIGIAGFGDAPEPILNEAYMRLAKTLKMKGSSLEKIGVVSDEETELPIEKCLPITRHREGRKTSGLDC